MGCSFFDLGRYAMECGRVWGGINVIKEIEKEAILAKCAGENHLQRCYQKSVRGQGKEKWTNLGVFVGATPAIPIMFALRGSSTTSPATTPLVPAPLTRSGLSTRRPAIEDLVFFGVVLWGCIVLTSVLSSFDILSCPIHGILDRR